MTTTVSETQAIKDLKYQNAKLQLGLAVLILFFVLAVFIAISASIDSSIYGKTILEKRYIKPYQYEILSNDETSYVHTGDYYEVQLVNGRTIRVNESEYKNYRVGNVYKD